MRAKDFKRVELAVDIDELTLRPDLDLNLVVSVEDFDSLIQPYQLQHNVSCQLLNKVDRCNSPNQHGWLIRTKCGKEALIGKDCAKNKFHAEHDFFKQTKILERQLSITQSLDFLNDVYQNKARFEKKIKECRERLKLLREKRESIVSSLPDSIKNSLIDMKKRQVSSVFVEILYESKNEKGESVVEWEKHSLGAISNIKMIGYEPISEIYKKYKKINKAFDEFEPVPDFGHKRLRGWVSDISLIDGVLKDINNLESDLNVFSSFDNLYLLLFVSPNVDDRKGVSFLINEICFNSSKSAFELSSLVKEIDSDLRKEIGGRQFRVCRQT